MKVKRTKYMYKKRAPWKKVIAVVFAVALLFGLGWFVSGHLADWISALTAPSAATSSSAPSSAASVLPESSEASVPRPGESGDSQPIASQPQTSQPAGLEAGVKALCPSGAQLHDDTALAAYCDSALLGGADTIIIDVKDTDGYLLYTNVGYDYATDTPHAVYSAVASKGGVDPAYIARAELDGVVQIIKSRNLNAVARINCMMDSYSGNAVKGAKLTLDSGNTTWLDDSKANGGKSWLNPYASVVADYTLTLAADCKYFGFDAVILDFVQYPVGFSTDRINYGAEAEGVSRKAGLENFINKVATCGLPVYLTVRNAAEGGSVEFAGSPFEYEVNIAGYIVIVNAPVSARRLAPSALTQPVVQGSYPTDKKVIMSVLATGYDAALDGLSEYVQLSW